MTFQIKRENGRLTVELLKNRLTIAQARYLARRLMEEASAEEESTHQKALEQGGIQDG